MYIHARRSVRLQEAPSMDGAWRIPIWWINIGGSVSFEVGGRSSNDDADNMWLVCRAFE
jgi:hypothetical protein